MGELEAITEKEAVKRLDFAEDMAREGKHLAVNLLFSEAMESLHAGICAARSLQKAVVEGFYEDKQYDDFIDKTYSCMLESSRWYWGSFLIHKKSRKSMYDVMFGLENIENHARRVLNSGRTNSYLIKFNSFVKESRKSLEKIFSTDKGYLKYRMVKAAQKENYKKAAEFRDSIHVLKDR